LRNISALHITKPDDILPAFSGIASRFAKHYHYQYLAGIWKQDIVYGLL
jgi:hypothetical protein